MDIAPNYVGTIMGISGLFSYFTGALVPNTLGLASALVSPDWVWTSLFLLVVGVTIISNMLFLLLGTAELQQWNSVSNSDSREKLHQLEEKGDARTAIENNLFIQKNGVDLDEGRIYKTGFSAMGGKDDDSSGKSLL